ncbi:unnamed protein product [Vitrella brassicaformis CCMP3155]|uniref:CRAL-TRIO domain-containing protein n=1 Tax=Vitrella brassicaformis (strain CCMP3155) TaxID=1169540 RepID=A0A0G4EQE7_VITBC|nr:unnamed protein product [Vitrella brassicaformis CCMP3155]|mmetsp:Transcript_38457/g.96345  ORF Transcript_38457/g.96345 Transcript_38457/m.96345 type:complete len:292 (-) Transcript_38457:316-1191(-)|eukprot:CEM00020.1 unnamed protein product [Vitrella brassicaformis CCMP3155]
MATKEDGSAAGAGPVGLVAPSKESLNESLGKLSSGDDAIRTAVDSFALEVGEAVDDETAVRFLRARGWDVSKAATMYRKHLTFRKERMDEHKMVCEPCVADPKSHCFLIIGGCRKNRPVLYGNSPRAAMTDAPSQLHHVICTLDRAFTVPDTAPQWVWCVDFNGFGLSHAVNVQLAKDCVSTFSNHFPERLGLLVLLDPPTVFQALWSVVSPLLDRNTAAKVRFVRAKETDGFLDELLPSAEKEWLQAVRVMRPVPGNLPPLPLSAKPFAMTPSADNAGEPAGGEELRRGG